MIFLFLFTNEFNLVWINNVGQVMISNVFSRKQDRKINTFCLNKKHFILTNHKYYKDS